MSTIQPTPSWQPLLIGSQRDDIVALVTTLTQSLMMELPTAAPVDLALYFATLAAMSPAAANPINTQPLVMRFLEQALSRLESEPIGVGLYGGLAGIGWTIAHLADEIGDAEAVAELLHPIDEALLAHLQQSPWPGAYDLIGGLVGIGVYALARLPAPAGSRLLEVVIQSLAALAEHNADGVAWPTSPAHLPDHQRREFPAGYYNLGVAHGIPGVIALLGHTIEQGIALASARPLLAGAVRWLLAQDSTLQVNEGFPAYLSAMHRPARARIAWCYGDLGIAVTLLGAARRAGEPGWESAAHAIATRAAQRPPNDSGVHDACLCHGAAGVAHLFNRLFQATGDEYFSDTARAWITATLALRQPGAGIGGYCFWHSQQGWLAQPGFLEGAAGIALALLAATSTHEPAWDRLLLIDIPPQSAHFSALTTLQGCKISLNASRWASS